MVSKDVLVTSRVNITVDETKFTPKFLEEFRASMYPFTNVDDHLEHLAQLYAREIVDEHTKFIEGYGPVADFGIKFRHVDIEMEVAS